MKKLLSFALSTFLTLAAFGQVDIKEINKSLAKVNDGLYASKYEVSNRMYMTFLNDLKQLNSIDLLTIAQIDTLKWSNKSCYNEPYVHYYHSHPAYYNYPVVNINYEGAKLFCEWLTNQYNANPKRKFKKVLFRLPSEEEWVTAAQAGDSSAIYPWQGNGLRKKDGQVMCNFKRETNDSLGMDKNQDITVAKNSYLPNNFGIYNMSGNVAEMINKKGIAKGGSWKDNPSYLKIDNNFKYDGNAQTFVGFRYFAEIIEK
ncbi:MAG: SUMF1/EgtB/PvdO family nonheme iron enzyme [Bacteroidetes bacterium]|nr:SUMF1/EgtB/PvdO family nonheme iron enzyme [Bacteroidota bacterium]